MIIVNVSYRPTGLVHAETRRECGAAKLMSKPPGRFKTEVCEQLLAVDRSECFGRLELDDDPCFYQQVRDPSVRASQLPSFTRINRNHGGTHAKQRNPTGDPHGMESSATSRGSGNLVRGEPALDSFEQLRRAGL